jgi:membrane protein implicated in regulation of membrane protease activity
MPRFPKPKVRQFDDGERQGSVTGRTATVVVAIPGGNARGEVMVRVRGGTETYMARADGPIAVGVNVLVVEDCGERTLFVIAL